MCVPLPEARLRLSVVLAISISLTLKYQLGYYITYYITKNGRMTLYA